MNPISNPNQVFSHDAVKYVYQEADMRMVNPATLNIKPFKVNNLEKNQKTKKNIKKKEDENKNSSSGLFDLF